MKSRLFRVLAVLLVIAMSVSLLSACGQGGGGILFHRHMMRPHLKRWTTGRQKRL